MDLNVRINQAGLQMHLQISWIALAAARKSLMASLATLATALAASGLLEVLGRLGQ